MCCWRLSLVKSQSIVLQHLHYELMQACAAAGGCTHELCPHSAGHQDLLNQPSQAHRLL